MSKLYVPDTNILLNGIESLQDYKLVLLSHTLKELEKHKNSKDSNLAYKARKTVRYIDNNRDKFVFDSKYYDGSKLGEGYTNNYEDYNIVRACLENNYSLISNDLLLTFVAEGFEIEVIKLNNIEEKYDDESYTGIKKIYLTQSDKDQQILADIYENKNIDKLNLLVNQYLIIYVDNEPVDKYRFDGEKLVPLRIPPLKVVKARNEEQECALDLLNNNNIPIKFIIGTYGSGKTYLNVKMSIYKVLEKGDHAKIMVIRNPLGSGEAIGYLKGTKEDKTQDFFKPFVQHLEGGEQEAYYLEQRGQLVKDIPFYLKGVDLQDSFVVVDEAEDLDHKLLRLIGTRISKNTVISFCGDYKQAEDKFTYNNGLRLAVEKLKGNPLVGIVALSEDIRSEASKVFADLM